MSIRREVFWYRQKPPRFSILDSDLSTDAVVVGGGMAGLTAAQKLSEAGMKVALIEKDFVGAGASGKTSGFITPDSELEFSDLVRNWGEARGKKLWQFAQSGVELIRQNILAEQIDCDYQIQDSLFAANSPRGFGIVREEYETQKRLGFPATLYRRGELPSVIGSSGYFGAVRYPDTFGINSYLYCRAMKDALARRGVVFAEKSPVKKIRGRQVFTDRFKITSRYVVVCADRYLPRLGIAPSEVYQVQTFLAASAPLAERTVRKIFPGDKMMVWDTDLIYQYYRITGDNRLLVGASSFIFTYYPCERRHSNLVLRKMISYLQSKFGRLDVRLEYFWPGFIGVSKDFAPLAGRAAENPSLYFAAAGAGLPWSAAIAGYICDKIEKSRDDLDFALSPDRKFAVGRAPQKLISKPVAFAISHGITKYLNK